MAISLEKPAVHTVQVQAALRTLMLGLALSLGLLLLETWIPGWPRLSYLLSVAGSLAQFRHQLNPRPPQSVQRLGLGYGLLICLVIVAFNHTWAAALMAVAACPWLIYRDLKNLLGKDPATL